MTKFEELLQELKVHTAAIEEILRAIEKELVGSNAEAKGQQQLFDPKPYEEKPITLEEVRAVLVEKSRAGFTSKVKELLGKYGADKLSDVKPENYKALIKDVEGLKNA